jgi:5-hydroxyisourate hydrolase-like protein (transthyretin family)
MPVLRQRLATWLIGGASVALVLTSVPATALAEPSAGPSPSAQPGPSAEPSAPADPAETGAAPQTSDLVVRWDPSARAGAARTASVRQGETVALTGTVTEGGAPSAGVTVVLDRGDHDGRTVPAEDATDWAEAARTVTASDGTFRFGVRLTRSSAFRARTPDGESSGVYAVAARTAVTISVTPAALRTVPDASRRALTGAATGADGAPAAGLTIAVEQRRHGAAWSVLTTTTTDANGAFRFLAVTGAGKLVYYRARSAQTETHDAATSPSVTHEIRHDPFDSAQIQRMIRSARASGLRVGVGLVDRTTGRTYDFGYRQSTFYTASVAKVMVAMDVLRDDMARGRTAPSATNARRIQSMIRNSNDAITWSYWRSRGGAAVVERINSRCGTSIAVYNNTWSMSRPSPVQMARVLDCLADHRALNAGLSGFLMYQMRKVTPAQRWGVPAANPDPVRDEMNKNGWWRWPCCYFWTVNSTGLFGPGNRYAFTVFTEYGGSAPQSRGERQAYNATRAMFPWGTIIY